MKYKKIIILLLIIFVIFILLGPLQIQKKVLMKIYPKEYEEIVDLNSEKYNVDKNLIFAIIKAESNFNEKAHSSKGAKGLMQLMESTAKDVLKGTQIQITDEELLEKTGGIVQGMSGSPIIQDGKLIGAVTHVFIQDSTKGYGIFLEEMKQMDTK